MGHSKRVMIVEDDPLLSIVEQKMVEKLGYIVIGKAISGEEALSKFRELDPEILIIDIQLAGNLNGIETVERLKKVHPDLSVIFLSGDRSSEILNRARKIDYIDFLLKPVSSIELSKPLKKATEQNELVSQNAA
jgi:YesN/AraC family two-component response regulator